MVTLIEKKTAPGVGARAVLPRGARRGSSLIEMVIAIVVLGAVLISMLGMFLISRTAVHSKEDETANSLALRCIERIETKDFAELSTPGPLDISAITGNFPTTQYTATANVLSADNYSALVNVEVEWKGAGPSKMVGGRKVTLTRVISAGGHKNVGMN
jgi:type II secretory pathway pseudopilin PulG